MGTGEWNRMTELYVLSSCAETWYGIVEPDLLLGWAGAYRSGDALGSLSYLSSAVSFGVGRFDQLLLENSIHLFFFCSAVVYQMGCVISLYFCRCRSLMCLFYHKAQSARCDGFWRTGFVHPLRLPCASWQAFRLRISPVPDLCFWVVIISLFTSGFVVKLCRIENRDDSKWSHVAGGCGVEGIIGWLF